MRRLHMRTKQTISDAPNEWTRDSSFPHRFFRRIGQHGSSEKREIDGQIDMLKTLRVCNLNITIFQKRFALSQLGSYHQLVSAITICSSSCFVYMCIVVRHSNWTA